MPFHPGDYPSAVQWMKWGKELGGFMNHSLILMPSKSITDFEALLDLARDVFQSVDVLKDSEGIDGHPQGPNCMMRQAVWHCQTASVGPWMFLEPDCIPMCLDALDKWEREYRAFDKPFMGEFRPASGVTPDYLSGNMVIPKDALLKAPMLGRRGLSRDNVELAFDIVAASQILPQAHLTKLLQQLPKNADGSSHTFEDQESLNVLRDGAVFFHPCKDGSLIERLKERKRGDAKCAATASNSGVCPAPSTANTVASEAVVTFQPEAPATWIGQVREHVTAIAEMTTTSTKKQLFHQELRKQGLLGPARKRKS
jgi:hypothetical protein